VPIGPCLIWKVTLIIPYKIILMYDRKVVKIHLMGIALVIKHGKAYNIEIVTNEFANEFPTELNIYSKLFYDRLNMNY
jgi:hypothetical protein